MPKKAKMWIDEFLDNTLLPIFFYPDSNDINERSNENSMTIAATAFFASLNTLFWHFWWIIPIIIISLVRNFDKLFFNFLGSCMYFIPWIHQPFMNLYFVIYFSWLFISTSWEWTNLTIHHFTQDHYNKRK